MLRTWIALVAAALLLAAAARRPNEVPSTIRSARRSAAQAPPAMPSDPNEPKKSSVREFPVEDISDSRSISEDADCESESASPARAQCLVATAVADADALQRVAALRRMPTSITDEQKAILGSRLVSELDPTVRPELVAVLRGIGMLPHEGGDERLDDIQTSGERVLRRSGEWVGLAK